MVALLSATLLMHGCTSFRAAPLHGAHGVGPDLYAGDRALVTLHSGITLSLKVSEVSSEAIIGQDLDAAGKPVVSVPLDEVRTLEVRRYDRTLTWKRTAKLVLIPLAVVAVGFALLVRAAERNSD
jgi:hypothetical protein